MGRLANCRHGAPARNVLTHHCCGCCLCLSLCLNPLFLPQHLGDFPHRLSQHCHAVYEYTPPPPMSWPELADEIWCHRYYLANLCDEDRFRNWPVVEHIPLLQVRRLAGIACATALTVCWHASWLVHAGKW